MIDALKKIYKTEGIRGLYKASGFRFGRKSELSVEQNVTVLFLTGFSSWIVRCFARCDAIHDVRGDEEQIQ